MTAITMISTYLSSIDRLVQQNTAGAKSNTAEKSILDSIHQTSPEKADALEKRLEDATCVRGVASPNIKFDIWRRDPRMFFEDIGKALNFVRAINA